MPIGTFLDANVFIYQLDGSDPRKQAVAQGLVRQALLAQDACISFRVVQERLNVITTKARVRLSATEAQNDLDAMLAP